MGGKQLKPKGVFVYQGCIHRTTAVAPKVSNLFVKFWRRLDSSNKCLIFKQVFRCILLSKVICGYFWKK